MRAAFALAACRLHDSSFGTDRVGFQIQILLRRVTITVQPRILIPPAFWFKLVTFHTSGLRKSKSQWLPVLRDLKKSPQKHLEFGGRSDSKLITSKAVQVVEDFGLRDLFLTLERMLFPVAFDKDLLCSPMRRHWFSSILQHRDDYD